MTETRNLPDALKELDEAYESVQHAATQFEKAYAELDTDEVKKALDVALEDVQQGAADVAEAWGHMKKAIEDLFSHTARHLGAEMEDVLSDL